jgi:hypothetical protein
MIRHDLIGDMLDSDGSQRGLGRWFPDCRIPTGSGDGCIPGPNRYRKIKGRDDTDGSKGMPLLVHPVSWTLGMHGQTIQLPGKPDGKITDIDHLLNFSMALSPDLSHFQGNQISE